MIAMSVLAVFLVAAEQGACPRSALCHQLGIAAMLPEPWVGPRLDAAEQDAAIERLLGSEREKGLFLRPALSAPFHLEIGTAEPTATGQLRTVDLAFVVAAPASVVTRPGLLEEFADFEQRSDEHSGQGAPLSAEALVARGITPPADDRHERYLHGSAELLDRVLLSGVVRIARRSEPGVAAFAGVLDPRFAGDGEFPNQYRSLTRNAVGRTVAGEATPYGPLAGYVQVIDLQGHEGMSLVEAHSIFEEPTGWFEGRDVLRAKLPLLVRDRVRQLRARLRSEMR